MIRFLLLGLFRDRSRSLFPVLVVSAGVFITVLGYGWVGGAIDNFLDASARFQSGHVKVMTQAYYEEMDQVPNDLALANVSRRISALKNQFPEMDWTPRIKFGGLLDIPDENDDTKAQSPVMGIAVELLDPESPERHLLNLESALVTGTFPTQNYQILISHNLAETLGVQPGDKATLLTSTIYGGMTFQNFTIAGTVRFGVAAMDRGAVIADIHDIQFVLDMPDMSGEILGFFRAGGIDREQTAAISHSYNSTARDETGLDVSMMQAIQDSSGLAGIMEMLDSMGGIMIFFFVFVMSLVLWNTGLMGSLRRYGEIGVRLAMGEAKRHVYQTMILEGILVGLVGSAIGTILGVVLTWYLQVVGVDISGAMNGTTILMGNVIRAKLTSVSFMIGFIPGFIATILGAAFAGLGIYKRETAQLFKELEV